MISAVLKAIGDITSRQMRSIIWKALGLTIALFFGILIAAEIMLSLLTAFPWPWLSTLLAVATGLGIFAAFIFLMAPVTAIFAGLYLDDIAGFVEHRQYPHDAAGKPLRTVVALKTGLQFGLLVLMVNLAILPMLLFGIGALMLVIGNAYLLGREYFSMIAMRHLQVADANQLRKQNAGKVFAAGLVPAGLALVPVLNLFVPVFSTCYFVHIFKQIRTD